MGICKKCKKVFNTIDMARGYCKNCVSPTKFITLKDEQDFINSIKSIGLSIISIIVLIVFVGLMNGALDFGQKVYYKNDIEKCKILKREVTSLEKEIITIEKYLSNQKVELSRIKKLKRYVHVEQFDYTYDYKQLVANIQSNTNRYNDLIYQYNNKIKEHDEIAEKAYSRYSIVIGRH